MKFLEFSESQLLAEKQSQYVPLEPENFIQTTDTELTQAEPDHIAEIELRASEEASSQLYATIPKDEVIEAFETVDEPQGRSAKNLTTL